MVRIRRVNSIGRTSRVLESHLGGGSRVSCFTIGNAMRIANVPSSMVHLEDALRGTGSNPQFA